MKRRLAAAVTVAGLLGVTAVADAHHPEVVALAGCVQNARASLFVTATAWAAGDPAHRVNAAIAIDVWNGASWQTVDQGAFELDAPSFTKAVWVPANQGAPVTARVRARALVAWGPQQQFGSAGESREASATITRNCDTPTATVSSTTRPSLPPSTTVLEQAPTPKPPVTIATSSTVLMRAPSLPDAPAAAAVVATPRFTG